MRALAQARASAERALEAARRARAAGTEAVAGELERLRAIRERIVEITKDAATASPGTG